MRKRVLYYACFFDVSQYDHPNYRDVAYVKAQYSDGSIRYWYSKDKGFKSAKYKAMHSENR
jgi:hypothetical protein